MKKFFVLFLLFTSTMVFSQLENTKWVLAPKAAALAVGPIQGDGGTWWANTSDDVINSACRFDDLIEFDTDGTFRDNLGGDTWIEPWQGIEGCGTPVAPHDGSGAATWAYNDVSKILTITGIGAYIGLPKVFNGGELTELAGAYDVSSIEYIVTSLTDNEMILDISIGSGWWRFEYVKLEPGDKCELAVPASDGENTLPATVFNEYWYTYTMPSEGKLQITSSANTYVNIVKGNCSDNYVEENGYNNLTVTSLSAGDEIFITWDTYNGGDFNWNLAVTPFGPGENCALAAAASDGENVLPATSVNEYWYKYTMPSEGKLQITSSANTYVSILSGSCNNYNWEGDGYNNATATGLSAGDEVFIRWDTYSGGDFNWNLAVVPFQPGEKCALAVAASDGENVLPATSANEYWYKYTMPSEGKLQITSSANTYVSILSGSCNNYNWEGDGYNKVTAINLSAGDEVFIRWDTYSGGDFNWNLAVTPFQPGEKCALAVSASDGENVLPATSANEYWYTYTMPSEGKLQITSSANAYVYIFTGSCSNTSYEADGYNNATVTSLSSGDEVFIRWNTYNGGDFSWNIAITPLAPGDNCEMVVAATDGENVLPATSVNEYWYTYTMPSEGKLQITSSAETSVSILSGSCTNYDWEGQGYNNATATGLSAGDEVFIKWDTYNGGDFNWTLAVTPFQPGEKCELAVSASEGENILPATSTYEYWYTYTMPSDSKLQITSSEDAYVRVYVGYCENMDEIDGSWEDLTITSLSAGELVFITWETYNGGDFSWNIATLPLQSGDNCELAVAASDGENILPATTANEYWYTYTMPSDGKLQITSSSGEYVSVHDGYCGDLDWIGDEWQNLTVTSLLAGDQVFIKWDTYEGGNFNWTLNVAPFEAGDKCDLAVTAVEGENVRPAAPMYEYWYTYTMPSDSKLQITSSVDEYVRVYEGYCENLDEIDGSWEDITITSLSAGDQVFISWTNYYENEFDWNMSLVPLEPGDNCEMAVSATDGLNSVPTTNNQYYWYTYTMPSAGKLQITSSDDNYVYVMAGNCSDLSWQESGYNRLTLTSISTEDELGVLSTHTPLAEGDVVFIRWDTYYGGEFDWNISVVDLAPGDDCSNTVTAIEGTNTVPELATDQSYWYKYTVAASGKLVITSTSDNYVSVYSGNCDNLVYKTSGDELINVSNLSVGDVIYFEWDTDGGSSFEWDLAVAAVESAEDCSTAAIAIEGINSLPATDMELYWYTFTMPAGGGRLEITSENGNQIIAFTNSCDYTDFIAVGYENLSIGSLAAGEEVFIQWEADGEDFDWNLSVVPLEAGDNCSLATVASIGDNTAARTDYWFSFEASKTATYIFSTIDKGSNEPYLRIYSDCGGALLGGGFDEDIVELSLSSGEIVYILCSDWESNVGYDLNIAEKGVVLLTQTITLESIPDKTFGDADFDLSASASSGLDVSFEIVNGPATISGNTLSITGAGNITIRVKQSGNETYAPTYILKTITVAKADQQITIEPILEKSTADPAFDIVASSTSGLELNYSVSGPASVSDATITLDGTVGTVTVTVNQPGNENYNAASVEVSFDVSSKTAQSISFEAIAEKTYGDADFDIVATASSGLAVSLELLSGPATLTGNTVSITGTGIITIGASQAGNDVYAGASASIAITVIKADQDITFEAIANQILEDGSLSLVATSTSGLPVSFEIVSGPATVDGTVVSFSDVGTVIVMASQTGDDNYNAATPVEQSFEISSNTSIDINQIAGLKVYPNPVGDLLILETNNFEVKQIQLINARGAIAAEYDPEIRSLDLSGLTPGLYLLKVSSSDKMVTRRIIKN